MGKGPWLAAVWLCVGLAGCQAVQIGDLSPASSTSTPPPAQTSTPTGTATPTLSSPTPSVSSSPATPSPTLGVDTDGDGYAPPLDCDDASVSIHPGATERCDGADQDCDEAIDEGVLRTFYEDADHDLYGDPESAQQACLPIPGYVSDDEDCDDGDAAIHPSAPEVCDGADQDCDEAIDEGAIPTWYADGDLDGWGGAAMPSESCTAPEGTVARGEDCDDAQPRAFPGAPFEYQDAIDNDCDGETDEVQRADTAGEIWSGGADGGWVGSAMTGLWDFDDDGLPDLALGEPWFQNGKGQARILYGVPPGAERTSDDTAFLVGDAGFTGAGLSLAGRGDVDGDGRGDLAVGQPWYNLFSGRVTLVKGNKTRLTGSHDLDDAGVTIDGPFGINLGNAMAFADMDGDGYDDLVVGAPYWEFLTGHAFVLWGGPGGLGSASGRIDLRQYPEQEDVEAPEGAGNFGYSLASIGDFDGDGRGDVAIAAPSVVVDFSDGRLPQPGRAPSDECESCSQILILFGAPRLEIGAEGNVAVIAGTQDSDGLGMGIGGAGDVDGDGYDDLLIGAPFYDDESANTGSAWLFRGGVDLRGGHLDTRDASLRFACPQSDCNLGHLYSVGGTGDVNGDGYGDLFIGAVKGSLGEPGGTGIGGLFLGPVEGDGRRSLYDADALFQGMSTGDSFGSVGLLGDVDQDGFADLLLGAYTKAEGDRDIGQAYRFSGY